MATQKNKESFHSSGHFLLPGRVEVSVLGDFTSGSRTVVAGEALERVVFLYVLRGRTVIRLSDAGEMSLGAADILVVFPGRMMTVELTARSNRLMAVVLSGPGAVSASLGMGFWDLMRAQERYGGNYMSEIIARFHSSPERGRDPWILSQVEHLLTTVWLRVRHGSGRGPLFDAVGTLNRRICEGGFPTTEAAATALGFSRSKLNALFTDGMGIRPGEYISRVITHLAQSALFHTKDPVAAIARDLGFSSSSAFAAFLRRRIGQTPAEFRRCPIPISRKWRLKVR